MGLIYNNHEKYCQSLNTKLSHLLRHEERTSIVIIIVFHLQNNMFYDRIPYLRQNSHPPLITLHFHGRKRERERGLKVISTIKLNIKPVTSNKTDESSLLVLRLNYRKLGKKTTKKHRSRQQSRESWATHYRFFFFFPRQC